MRKDLKQKRSHQGEAKTYIHENLADLPMPTRSPDVNSIENVWSVLKKNVRKHLCQILEELEDAINLKCNILPENLVIEIANSFHLRMIKLINSNGNRIMY